MASTRRCHRGRRSRQRSRGLRRDRLCSSEGRETVPFSSLAFSFWLAPRAGSFMRKAMSRAMMVPGMAETMKDVAPAVVFADGSADEVAERGADEEGDVEDGEDAVALIFGVEVREDRGGEDAEAGFAYAESGVADASASRRSGRWR